MKLPFNKGQAILEGLICCFIIYSFLVVLFVLFLLYSKHIWIDFQLHQSLICLAKDISKFKCERDLIKGIKNLFYIGKVRVLYLKQYGKYQWKGHVLWRIWIWDIKIKKTLSLNPALQ